MVAKGQAATSPSKAATHPKHVPRPIWATEYEIARGGADADLIALIEMKIVAKWRAANCGCLNLRLTFYLNE